MMMFLVRNSPVSSATNRLIYLMFLFSPWIIIYLIWQWNQDYYFDALGIRIILVEIVFIEFISMGMLVFEVIGTGTNLPHFINDTVTLLFYSLIVFFLLALNIFFAYLLLQTEERPHIPLVKPEKLSQPNNKDLHLSENSSELSNKKVKEERSVLIQDKPDSIKPQETSSAPTRPKIINEIKKSSKSSSSKTSTTRKKRKSTKSKKE